MVGAFARRIGAEAVGTPLEFSGGKASRRLVGNVNTGASKAQRRSEWLEVHQLSLHAAYGDTVADLEMLELSEEPVTVCPDSGLREKALEERWRVLGDENDG